MNTRLLLISVVALLLLWATRLQALEILPLHNDEGLHLTRAVEVWNGHPFWAISDGKIINHWLIAAFYPQNAPVFVARIATVLMAVLGLASALALGHFMGGHLGAALAAALWIASPYLFFYERLAFSDAEAGALSVIALLFAARFTQAGRLRCAALAGLFLSLAVLFKFTAAPYAVGVLLVILLAGSLNSSVRIRALLLVAGIGLLCFVPPLIYLGLRNRGFFTIALGWIGGSSGGELSLIDNLRRFVEQLSGFGTIAWVLVASAGLVLLVLISFGLVSGSLRSGRRTSMVLLVAVVLPLAIMMLLGREVLSRHWVVALPPLLTLAGGSLGIGLQRVRDRTARSLMAALGVCGLLLGGAPFMMQAFGEPSRLPLPADARYEHITSHSSGYGLREAVQSFPVTISRPDLNIVASMFPDSCRRANFYADNVHHMICTDAPGLDLVKKEISMRGAVYVLSDSAPLIGLTGADLPGRSVQIATFARPGESTRSASVVLWLVEATNP